MSRPEATGPAELYYDEDEAAKYRQGSRLAHIQRQMTERALELLALPNRPCLLLDIGCGSGLSGEVLKEHGHEYIGVDISEAMLAVNEHDHLVNQDIGEGLPFTAGLFDGCVSISVLQWLCYSNKKTEYPPKRLLRFFQSLYSSLCQGARAVFQLYPENEDQLDLIQRCATKAGFTGGLVIDYPNSTRAKKFYLTLFCGRRPSQLPSALEGSSNDDNGNGEEDRIAHAKARINENRIKRQNRYFNRGRKDLAPAKGSREWNLKRTLKRALQGQDVRPVSKYSGRARKGHGQF